MKQKYFRCKGCDFHCSETTSRNYQNLEFIDFKLNTIQGHRFAQEEI